MFAGRCYKISRNPSHLIKLVFFWSSCSFIPNHIHVLCIQIVVCCFNFWKHDMNAWYFCYHLYWVFLGKKENEILGIVFVIYIYYRYNPFCIKFFNYCIILVTLFGSFYLMPMFLQTRQMIMKIIVKLLILMFVTKTDKLLDSINKSKTL